MRSRYVIIAVLLAVLVPVGLAVRGGSSGNTAAAPSAPLAVIAKRVEALRGLRYRKVPKPVRVTAEEATREGLADLDRGYPLAAQRADEALYTLLGLLPPGTDLRDLSGSIFGEEVSGYYDPRSKRLRIVEGAATSNRVLDEIVLAHELAHALEDQRIGIDVEALTDTGDRGYAYKALLEGTATEVMYGYLERHFPPDVALGGLLGGSLSAGIPADLPPFISAGLLFPYQQGQRFVSALYRRGGRSWTLVDLAERTRPPVTTEQILHPAKWIAVEGGDPVTVPAPGKGWRRLAAGTFGEWQTGQLLALAGRAQPDVAAGWGGDRYALYRRGSGACAAPCPKRDALVMRWRWDAPRDAAEFGPALRSALTDGLGAEPAPDRRGYSLRGAAVAVAESGGATTMVFAPAQGLALRLARATLRE